MSKNKLKKFDEMNSFSNVLQPPFEEVFRKNFLLKGKWNKEFFGNENPITLELGCGKGEYTVEMARHYSERNFIGIDIKGARIWKGAKMALNEGISNAGFLRTRIDFIESFFTPGEVHEIWITFPDPQPAKTLKRLTSSRFLNRYRKILINGGTINLKTDNAALYFYTKSLIEYNNLKMGTATDDLYGSDCDNTLLSIRTYYENMWLNAGMPIHFLRFKLPSDQIIEEVPNES